MFELIGKTDIDFLGLKKIAFTCSSVVVILGVVGMLQLFRGKGNVGIDFAGGTAIQLKFEKHLEIERAREILDKGGIKGADLQEFTSENKLLIRVKTSADQKLADKIIAVFKQENNPFVVDSSIEIGPSVGKKLFNDTMFAVLISAVGIIAYVAIRFEFIYGVAAALATVHDVLAVIGVLYVLDKEFTILIVTSLLTLAGYSLTDTVVIFDRIRENLKKRKGGELSTVINKAMNEVLGRTTITSLTTLLVLVALYFFGGEVLHDFSLALIIGVVVGNYSSLFVASPLVELWGQKNAGNASK